MVKKAVTVLVLLLVSMTTVILAQDNDSDAAFNDYIINLPKEELSDQELASLMQMREEEKLARDVYLTLYDKWQMNIFNNIAKSEQTHTDMVALILVKYNLEDPFIDERGVFKDSTIQELYNTLVGIGSESLAKGLFIGCTIEDLDIYDLEELLAQADNQDIRTVYQNLMKGSRNHMRSFNQQYTAQGETYVAQYITAEELEQILNSDAEQGFLDADGNQLVLTAVEDTEENVDLPETFIMAQNYPNPFNPQTTIQFSLPNTATVSVNVYDIHGSLVKTLVNNERLSQGTHSVVWNGTNENGNVVSSGIYLYVINNGATRISKQMILLK